MARKPDVSHWRTASITSLRPIIWILGSTINSWLGAWKLISATGANLGEDEQPAAASKSKKINLFMLVSSYKKGEDQSSDKAA
jgi:hypothetical protein